MSWKMGILRGKTFKEYAMSGRVLKQTRYSAGRTTDYRLEILSLVDLHLPYRKAVPPQSPGLPLRLPWVTDLEKEALDFPG